MQSRSSRTPSSWSDIQPHARSPAPHAGKRSRESLEQIGDPADEIEGLLADDAVRRWSPAA
jgi:hypothetical protein